METPNSIQQPEQTRPSVLTAGFQEQRLARVYAEALIKSAAQQGQVEEVREELRLLLQDIFRRQPDLERFLSSPLVGPEHKERLLRSTFQDRSSEVFLRFLLVLNRHERLPLLRAVYHAYCELHNQQARRIPVKVITAIPLTEEQANRLRDELRRSLQREPLLENEVEPDILGGIMLRVEDWLFDGSVRSRIDNIRKELLARSSHEIQRRRDRFYHPK